MTHPAKALTLSTAALLAAALNAPLFAQVANPAAGAQGVNPAAGARPNAANANAAAVDDQHHTQQVITHALNMAVNGSDLQLAAHAYGRNRQGQGRAEGQARNRNADNRTENQANNDNRNANADNRRNEDANANNDNRRNENAANDRRENNQEQQAHQQAVHQLRVQAWRQFENGERLLRDANATLGAEGNNAAGAGREDSRNAWTRRLLTASEQYATTLRALTGVGNREPQASGSNEDQNQANRDRDRNDANQNQANRDRDRADANQNQANRDRDRADANQNQANRGNDNQNERSGWLNRGEASQVALLNQAVREAIEAFELNRSHHHIFGANQGGEIHASARRLQEHARQMSADSQQLVQQVQAGLNNEQGNQDRERQGNQDQNRQANQDQRNANARNQGDNNNNDRNNNDRQGQASVRLLAQQAQQVIETLQRINPAAAQGGAAR